MIRLAKLKTYANSLEWSYCDTRNANVQHEFEIMFFCNFVFFFFFWLLTNPGFFWIVNTQSRYRGFGNVMMARMWKCLFWISFSKMVRIFSVVKISKDQMQNSLNSLQKKKTSGEVWSTNDAIWQRKYIQPPYIALAINEGPMEKARFFFSPLSTREKINTAIPGPNPLTYKLHTCEISHTQTQ